MIKALLLLLKFAKFGPLLKSAGFMLLSVGSYALLFGWRYAVGFVALVYVHELGHYFSARRQGLDVGLPVMIPFLGAWTALKDRPLSVEQEARIAFAGPFVGTAATVLVLAAAMDMHSGLLMALAYAGFFVNLFNLLPIIPFDGGHVVAVLSPRTWLIGAPLLVFVLLWLRSPFLLLILILLAPTIWAAVKAAWHGTLEQENPRYYEAPLEARVRYASYYLVLVAFLSYMTWLTHQQVEALRQA